MTLKLIAAAVLSLGLAASSYADTYTFTTDAMNNSTTDGVGSHAVEGALALTSGEAFTVNTDAAQIWHGATMGDPNYDYFTSNADGAAGYAYAPSLAGIGQVKVGTLVADINGDYRIIGAGTQSFTAWGDGELVFHYADINNGDNSGAIMSTVTTAVPEPETYAMLLAGLAVVGAIARRRRNA